jgi:hypothetical protein
MTEHLWGCVTMGEGSTDPRANTRVGPHAATVLFLSSSSSMGAARAEAAKAARLRNLIFDRNSGVILRKD